eukprot:g1852.t1
MATIPLDDHEDDAIDKNLISANEKDEECIRAEEGNGIESFDVISIESSSSLTDSVPKTSNNIRNRSRNSSFRQARSSLFRCGKIKWFLVLVSGVLGASLIGYAVITFALRRSVTNGNCNILSPLGLRGDQQKQTVNNKNTEGKNDMYPASTTRAKPSNGCSKKYQQPTAFGDTDFRILTFDSTTELTITVPIEKQGDPSARTYLLHIPPEQQCASDTNSTARDNAGSSKNSVSFLDYLNATDLGSDGNPNGPKPLVLSFHGWTGTGAGEEHNTGWSKLANRENFFVVYPNGMNDIRTDDDPNRKPENYGSWNTIGSIGSTKAEPTCTSTHYDIPCYKSCARRNLCPPETTPPPAKGTGYDCNWTTCLDDLSFIASVLDTLTESLCVDLSRIYVSGMSNGAMFTYRIASSPKLAKRIAAVVPFAGSFQKGFLGGPPEGYHVPLMDVHGDSDLTIPAEDPSSKSNGFVDGQGWFYEARHRIVRQWLYRDPQRELPVPTKYKTRFDDHSKENLSCSAYNNDENNNLVQDSVVTCLFEGGHTWPSDPSQLAWDFMKRFTRITREEKL